MLRGDNVGSGVVANVVASTTATEQSALDLYYSTLNNASDYRTNQLAYIGPPNRSPFVR